MTLTDPNKPHSSLMGPYGSSGMGPYGAALGYRSLGIQGQDGHPDFLRLAEEKAGRAILSADGGSL